MQSTGPVERRLFPFVRLNCAAHSQGPLEAELFGYEPGLLLEASSLRASPASCELAHQGRFSWMRLARLPLEMQPKLLRILEEKEVERLGGTRIIKSDFRLIAATPMKTWKNVWHRVSSGKTLLPVKCHSAPYAHA